MTYSIALIDGLIEQDTQSSDHMTRAQRDALRIHAQQILACLTSPQETEQNTEAVNYLLSDLENTAVAMANDYADNNERAFQQKEYDKWKKIETICQQERERLSDCQQGLAPLGHHAMGRGTATCLLGDMSNLSYVLTMNVAGILKASTTLTTAFGSAASSISSVAGTMNTVQPYLGIGLYGALVVFDTVCIAKHKYEREIEGHKKKREKSYTKLLEHGRWMHWVNAAAWITAGILSTLAFATPVIIVSVMACAIFITSVVRIVHQTVELTKLMDVKKSYLKQLADETIAPSKRAALQMLEAKATEKIKMHQGKLVATTVLATCTMIGIGLLIAAIAISCPPLMIVGAIILLAAGLATIITNRQAIGAAFKTIFKQGNKKKEAAKKPDWVESSDCTDEDDNLSMVAQPDHEQDEFNRQFSELADGDEKETSTAEKAKEAGITYAGQVPEDTRTKRTLSSMARTYRPPTGDSKDVVAGIEKRKTQMQEEALREVEDDESDTI